MKIFNISDFGAAGDGKTLNTAAIQSAIDECAREGGGRVLIENGVFMSGSISLKDNVELHIGQNGVLLGSPNVSDYPEKENLKHVNSDFLPRWRNACFIFADECENISLTGRGKIDCNGTSFILPDESSDTWRYKRIAAPTPPRVVFFTGCRNVLIEGVTMVNQPAGWSYWIHDCGYVNISKITIDANVDYPNNDGIHINASRRVTVSDCNISCGDDCIVLRANNASLKENKVCEHVTVTNCNLTSYSGAVRIGWTQDGIIRNCTLSNLVITDTSVGISLLIPYHERTDKKSGDIACADVGREETLIENITFCNIIMDRQCSYPVYINIHDNEKLKFKGIRRLHFSGLHSCGPELPHITGTKDYPVEDISFSDCSFAITDGSEFESRQNHGWTGLADQEPYHPMTVKHAKNISFNNTVFSNI